MRIADDLSFATTPDFTSRCIAQTLTRPGLERAIMSWAKQYEGVIAHEAVSALIENGEVLQALNLTALSMQDKKQTFSDNNACLIWSAWMNYQEFGTPGFPLSKMDDF